MKSAKNKKRNILMIIFFVIIFIALGVILMLTQRVTMNPAGTVGNTAGNLNNAGLFCEYDGCVYFSNSSAGGHLYAMNPDESDVRELNTLNVRNILAGGKYLYFFQTGTSQTTPTKTGLSGVLSVHSFIRSNLRGKSSTTLVKDVVAAGQLVDNYLYLMTTGDKLSFVKMKIDKSETTELANYQINPASVSNGVIYYNGTQNNHYLYGLNTSTDSVEEIWQGNVWYPVVEGDYVYYMDVAENYRLCRYSLSENLIEVLTNDRVDCFNVGNGYVYYQTNGSSPQLVCIHTDGSNPIVVAEGIYTNINMTSRYVYFQKFGNEGILYHSPLGADYMEIFDAK